MVTSDKQLVGDTSGRKLPLSQEQAAESANRIRLRTHYRPEERTRPVVFDTLDSLVSYLGITWNQLGSILECPDNNTVWRWKHERVSPSFKYLLKGLATALNEAFRRDKEFTSTLHPLRELLIKELERLEEGAEIHIPESPAYPFELQGDWERKSGEFWSSKSKRILRRSRDLVESDKMAKYLAEWILDNA